MFVTFLFYLFCLWKNVDDFWLIKLLVVTITNLMWSNLLILFGYLLVQDDFLPRTATPLEDIFKSIFWLVVLPFLWYWYMKALGINLRVCVCNLFLIFLCLLLSIAKCDNGLLNQVLMIETACPAYYSWFAWGTPSYLRIGN
jgi:hypothetical protein